MWQFFRRLFAPFAVPPGPVRIVARDALLLRYPGFVACGTRLIEREDTRWVVAVFYEDPPRKSRPTKYKLFSVSNDLASAEELTGDASLPYRIRGRK
jgi:hypothetical protein